MNWSAPDYEVAARRSVVRQPIGSGFAFLVGPIVGLLVAYLVDRQGAGTLWLALGAAGVGGLLLAAAHRVHLSLLPITLVLPLVGYLTVAWPERGFSLIFDLAAFVPFALLLLRKLVRPSEVRLFDSRWWPVWAFLSVAMLQFLNPDGVSWLVNLQGLRRNVLPMLVFFVAANLDMSRTSSLSRTAWVSMAMAVIVAAWGLKQRLIGLDAVEELHAATVGTLWVGGTDLRMFSTLRVPWAFAAYIAAGGLIAVALAFAARTAKARVLASGAAALFSVTLVLALMRGALVGYATGLLLLGSAWLVRRHRRWSIGPVFLALVGLAATVVVLTVPLSSALRDSDNVVVQRVLSLATPFEDEAMLDRFFAWEYAGAIVLAHPLGLGLGTTAGVSARYEQMLRTEPIHTDNLYLAAFIETGWLGGCLLVILTLRIFAGAHRAVKGTSSRGEAWILLGIVASLVMFTIANSVTPVVWEPVTAHLYWVMAGITLNWTLRRPRHDLTRHADGPLA